MKNKSLSVFARKNIQSEKICFMTPLTIGTSKQPPHFLNVAVLALNFFISRHRRSAMKSHQFRFFRSSRLQNHCKYSLSRHLLVFGPKIKAMASRTKQPKIKAMASGVYENNQSDINSFASGVSQARFQVHIASQYPQQLS